MLERITLNVAVPPAAVTPKPPTCKNPLVVLVGPTTPEPTVKLTLSVKVLAVSSNIFEP